MRVEVGKSLASIIKGHNRGIPDVRDTVALMKAKEKKE